MKTRDLWINRLQKKQKRDTMIIRSLTKRKNKTQREKIHQKKRRNKRNIKRRKSKTSNPQNLLFKPILKYSEQDLNPNHKFKKPL